MNIDEAFEILMRKSPSLSSTSSLLIIESTFKKETISNKKYDINGSYNRHIDVINDENQIPNKILNDISMC